MSKNTNTSDYVADGITYINTSTLTGEGLYNPIGLAHIIAHEEYHHYGYSPFHSGYDWNFFVPEPPPPPCPLAQFHWWNG